MEALCSAVTPMELLEFGVSVVTSYPISLPALPPPSFWLFLFVTFVFVSEPIKYPEILQGCFVLCQF